MNAYKKIGASIAASGAAAGLALGVGGASAEVTEGSYDTELYFVSLLAPPIPAGTVTVDGDWLDVAGQRFLITPTTESGMADVYGTQPRRLDSATGGYIVTTADWITGLGRLVPR